ncbi:MAG TPA: hypothetical protein VI072_33850 [Polyangiaceae bacterium]
MGELRSKSEDRQVELADAPLRIGFPMKACIRDDPIERDAR